MVYICKYESPIGSMTAASNGIALTGLWFDGQKYFGSTLSERYEERDLPVFAKTRDWLDLYFYGKNPDFMPPLVVIGSDFRKAVWNILRQIPYGQTMTYGEIAKKMAKQMGTAQMSAQAVGAAVGRNPISVLIPCHRVVGSNGSLTGYAGGIEKKAALLELEKVDMKQFDWEYSDTLS
ncbi:Methylated-DNA--protein-cysteine methyltransferase [Eubacterium plexicaudatum ASF492]|uniref:Methylated-DNA--protein-cysteine methyltransferase n=1 Tax=Eubacterium plexicaudatum ASF492 TaxID=1235802 RepID=N2A9U8_9FIRM|nr:Methylated-DNA--protein-cysteine methyltransferase [Eubacterium plexicaudatum ASF492]